MPRPAGARNRDYEETRHRLAGAVADHLLGEDGEPATFKDLAAAAGVSQATLKHYFGDREGAFAAALDAVATDATPYLAAMAEVPAGRTVRESLLEVGEGFVAAWRVHGVGRVFSGALSVGIANGQRGPAVVTRVVEPLVQSTERLLAVHVGRGELRQDLPLREAALAYLGPLLVALLHQDPLGGAACRPLDLDAYLAVHVDLVLEGLLGA